MTWFIGANICGQVYPVMEVFGEEGSEYIDVYRAQTSSWKANEQDLRDFCPQEGVEYMKVGGHWNHYLTLENLLKISNVNGPILRLIDENPWAPAKMAEVSLKLDEKGNIAAILKNGIPVDDTPDDEEDDGDEPDFFTDEDEDEESDEDEEEADDEVPSDTDTSDTSSDDSSSEDSEDGDVSVTIKVTHYTSDPSKEEPKEPYHPRHSSGKYSEDAVKKFEELDNQLLNRLRKAMGK